MVEQAGTTIEGEGTPIEGEVEEKAERMGWVPLEEFRGDEKRWVSAEKFVERGENEIPIMRERMRKQDKTIQGLNKTVAGMSQTFAEFQKHQQGVVDRAFQKGVKAIEKKKLDAVERNDVDGYNAAVKEGEELVPETIPVETVVDPQLEASQAEFTEWQKDNGWFDDPTLQQYASDISGLVQKQTGLGGTKLYDKVREQVEAMYPDKFVNQNQAAPAAVAGAGGPSPPANAGKQTFGNLPKEAQDACNKFIKDIPGYTKKQYLADYEWE
jgi:uncharacterized coiled-coil protein SlyX